MKTTVTLILSIGLLLGIIISYITAVEIKKTEDGEFCSKCHTMAPMTQTHYKSTHGGANKFGVSAQCVDCHLPHDTILNYITTKVKFGTNDIFVELFRDGCLSCHTELDHSDMKSLEPEIVKKADNHILKTSCIECHPKVGHTGV